MHSENPASISEIRDSPSDWWLASLTVSRIDEEKASAFLFELGSTGIVTLEENSDSVTLGAYFEPRTMPTQLELLINAEFEPAGGVIISRVPDQDWMQKWKEGFEPVEIGQSLVVAPSWKLPAGADGQVIIQIDPGMAFGTGTHETTRLCLEMIERHWHGGSLLDIGTGTGILAIAAALIAPGARVVAIDVDPLAIEVARENLEINGVSDRVELIEGQPRNQSGGGYNAVVANLTAEVIIDLITDIAACLKTEGLLILSGILKELANDVKSSVGIAGLTLLDHREAGEWCALLARKS